MDHFKKLERQIKLRIFIATITIVSVSLVVFHTLMLLNFGVIIAGSLSIVTAMLVGYMSAALTTLQALEPVRTIWRAVLHVDPDHHSTPAPNLGDVKIGRELVNSLVLQIYQFASQQNSKDLIEHRQKISQAANIVNHLPLPLFVFNKELLVTNASNSALQYCQTESSQLLGKSLFETLRLEFPSEHTLAEWVKACQESKVTDTAYWERVHVLSKEDGSILKQCDIAAYYNRDNESGTEFIVTLFDKTERYTRDDDSLSFVALAVHELRTPITMLRGYIEVLDDELGSSLNDELKSFVAKMEASAKRLSNFVSNILNVARIDQNQLQLHLTEASWANTLRANTSDVAVRAKIHGKQLELDIAEGLPNVAVDQNSIYEVLTNIIENAIKYGGESTRILIRSNLNKDGLIETTVQDFGVGIPSSVIPNLFEKFSRNHRTRANVSGTGLGLYLSKAIVDAHGGQIWVLSKEGEGSTFGFTLMPYAQVKDELGASGNGEITRHAYGWIKNHSLYRK